VLPVREGAGRRRDRGRVEVSATEALTWREGAADRAGRRKGRPA
jgi:hypothetical protein